MYHTHKQLFLTLLIPFFSVIMHGQTPAVPPVAAPVVPAPGDKPASDKNAPVGWRKGDALFTYSGRLRSPDINWGARTSLLNKDIERDTFWYTQSTFDNTFKVLAGQEKYGYNVVEFLTTIRNRVRWGIPTSVAQTTEETIKLADFVVPPHRHFIGKMVLWIREAWLKFSLNAALMADKCETKHWLTFGAFPFELGRGISLGSAFAVGPGVLGFYTDDIVDQYAFGAKLSGEILKNSLMYDIYVGILQNKSDSFARNSEKVYAQIIGRRLNPARGFGNINYVLAGRTVWTALDDKEYGRMTIEPYLMYNHDPEQRIENVLVDANSKLGTIGLALEYKNDCWEAGFDTAVNFGRQQVLPLDRNRIDFENRSGAAVFVFSKVVDAGPLDPTAKPKKVLQTKEAQAIVDTSAQQVDQNGVKIGQIGSLSLYNSLDRFRAGYENQYRGWMFVFDAGYWLYAKELEFTAMAGVASGDENPNKNLEDVNDAEVDGVYDGFIGLQEVYRGKRVESALLLGAARKIPRPLTTPNEDVVASSRFSSLVSEFSNLIFFGLGSHWKPSWSTHKLYVRPNLLFYWEEAQTKKFDLCKKMTVNEFSDRFLGVELNTFMDFEVLPNLNMFMVGGVFWPGKHYDDIKGKPFNKAQLDALDELDVTGFVGDAPPILGNDSAYLVNIGFEYLF